MDFLRSAFHNADDYSFAGGAGAAQCGVPVVFPSYQVLRKRGRALKAELAFPDAKPFAGDSAYRREPGPG